MLKISLAVAITTLSAAVLADDARPWEVEVELGAVATSGNTETTSVNGKLNAKQNLTKFRNEYVISSLFKDDEVVQDDNTKQKERTADKYFISGKSAYMLENGPQEDGKKSSYLFGFASYAHDKFGAYRTYKTVSLGYGDWLYSNDTINWFVEAGPGYFLGEKAVETGNPETPYILEDEKGALLRLATEFDWKFSQTAVFKQILSVEAGSGNKRILSETSVAASITNAMQMKLGFSVASDSSVAAGKEKTDTVTSATIVYKF